MLELILSRSRKQNTAAVMQGISAAVSKRREGQILIVPEQFSHDAERLLCETCGDTVSLYAEVLSFTRLADRVFSVCGGICRETLDDGGRLTALTLALEQVLSRLKIYAPARNKPEMIAQLAAQIEEFKNYGITYDALMDACSRFQGAFAQKLEELALILEGYDAVCATGRADPSSKLERLRELLWETDYAKGKTFWLDGFTDYTGLQMEILRVLLEMGASVTVTLVLDDVRSGEMIFESAREAAKQLIRAAGTSEVRIRMPAEEEDPVSLFLRLHLFAHDAASWEGESNVVICRGMSAEEECRMAAAQIRKLMMGGLRCGEIAVACTDRAAYLPVLRPLLERCGIPAYYTGREDILREPMLRAVLAALEAATGGMEAEAVFTFLRSPIGPLERDACDRLQNYVFTWRISGTLWQKEWTMHPDGYEGQKDEASDLRLKELNIWRQQAAQPLLDLKKSLEKAKNTEQQVQALWEFLQLVKAEEKMRLLAEERSLTDQRAQELSQLYDVCVSAMEQLSLVLGATVRPAEDFAAMLRQLLSCYTLGTIPARLDAVTVGDLSSLRHQQKRALLVLGAGDGQLPKFSPDTGILTDQERTLLESETGLHLAPDRTGRMDRELATVYDVLCCGAEHLIMSYSGETPSYLVRRLQLLFPNAPVKTKELLLTDDRMAGSLLAACDAEDPFGALLRGLGREELLSAAEEIKARADYLLGSLSEDAVRLLYRSVIQLSASKIDLFSACKCAYFLQYGLHAKERKEASVDAPIFGTFVHYVLEHTARDVQEEGGFSAVSEERMQQIAERHIADFTAMQIGNMEEKDPRFRYLFERNLQEVRNVVDGLGDEMRKSSFEPEAYELDFRFGGTLPPVEVTAEKGSAQVVGFVDRVDLYHAEEADYVRVVDYKTGKKAFSYSDVLNGMGMQMLIYLFALEQYGSKLWGREVRPAGVLYFPARLPFLSARERPSEEEAAMEHQKNARRSGLLLDDERLLRAMEEFEDQPEYLPCKADKEGVLKGDLATKEQLKLLRAHVDATLRKITDQILEGEVRPDPYFQGNERSACRFCRFGAVCHLDSCDPQIRHFASKKPEEFWKRLEEARHG